MVKQRPQEASKALKTLINSTAFEVLTAIVGHFNLFKAIGIVRQEVRHFYLLAHLLDTRRAGRAGMPGEP